MPRISYAQLTRISDYTLDPHATHNLPAYPGAAPCGGRLLEEDFRTRHDRYEVYCERCISCWPNETSTREHVMQGVREMSGQSESEG